MSHFMSEYQEWLADFTEEQRKNYELCMKYPILVPHNAFTGKEVDAYDYEFTRLNNIPEGWRKAFGEDWARELQEAVNKLPEGEREEWYIVDLKEKFGQFDQFFSSYSDDINVVEQKYSRLSLRTCIKCGVRATKMSRGWICPYCSSCTESIGAYERFIDIDEWFSEVEEDD